MLQYHFYAAKLYLCLCLSYYQYLIIRCQVTDIVFSNLKDESSEKEMEVTIKLENNTTTNTETNKNNTTTNLLLHLCIFSTKDLIKNVYLPLSSKLYNKYCFLQPNVPFLTIYVPR